MKMTVMPERKTFFTLHLRVGYVWHVRIILFWFSLVYWRSCHPDLSVSVIRYATFDISKNILQFLGIIL